MLRQTFNLGWTAGAAQTAFDAMAGGGPTREVTLPWDAVRDLDRSAEAEANTGYFPGGYFRYSKTFDVGEDLRGKAVFFEFEGVYRDAVVYLNGDFVAQRPYGYSSFNFRADPYLRPGQANKIEVEARAHLDSRWYTGGGIYRNTHLIVGGPVHIALDGVRVTTPQVDDQLAVVLVDVNVQNEERVTKTVRLTTAVVAGDGSVVATSTSPVTLLPGSTVSTRLRLHVPEPALWDPESPHLYSALTELRGADEILDEDRATFGIRTLELDPQRGLRINGQPVKLRGTCLHHDTGLLGAAAISRAEERRVEILKQAGFNAIRSAHNPMSVAMLEACDRLGMLVVDETFDVWTQPKTPFDYSKDFPEWWERDVESMVTKDFNHPSVILYSIGNEVFEAGSPHGAAWSRRLSDKVRELDPTRYVTNGVNGLTAVSAVLPFPFTPFSEAAAGPTDVNYLISAMGDEINQFGASEQVSELIEESLAALDVAGFNYCDARYVPDRTDFPNRLILGTETFPGHIDQLWRLVLENSHVLGDFTWIGWDYLGEPGVGRTDYPDNNYQPSFLGPFPTLTGGVGDIDITGHRLPMSFYRETVYGLRREPYIAVHDPNHYGQPMIQSPWSWADAISSWSWDVEAGSPAIVDVYSDGDEVELLLDGAQVARAKVGEDKSFIARFETAYQPGELSAVAYRDGVETGRAVVVTAGDDVVLSVSPDRNELRADDSDLCYLTIELRDAAGTLVTHHDRLVTVEVSGTGMLVALGTGRTVTAERFDADHCTTYNGRATAIIRPSGAGEIEVRVSAQGCPGATSTLRAVGA
ncbi:Glycoside hydrolase family 2 sugar-binding protein [metagenome]|uniref:Glycoside hydrolase family 2 sugar-binding protein n=1 Tax=metagenome TaxID=256318 RepID=A0A2P2C3T1_9ZZZZ